MLLITFVLILAYYAGGSGQYRVGSVILSLETPRASSSVVTRTARSSSGCPNAMPSLCSLASTPPDTSAQMTSGTLLHDERVKKYYFSFPLSKKKLSKLWLGKYFLLSWPLFPVTIMTARWVLMTGRLSERLETLTPLLTIPGNRG